MYSMQESKRGFFFQFLDPADPVGSKYQMNGQVLQDQQLIVVFAKENRRKAADKGIEVNLLTFLITLLKFKVSSSLCECFKIEGYRNIKSVLWGSHFDRVFGLGKKNLLDKYSEIQKFHLSLLFGTNGFTL